ncbi:GGDEF domain-containing protein [Gracilibacillus sp. D59]|uniref:GGDEF domain-containing protein n=1 Tax=Gracilibacillus sp. D59 TaxID=3457434 RepID=UPI003FCD2E13
MLFLQIQSQIATSKNPLTQLPGNFLIDEQLERLPFTEKYIVLYIDLDQFKAYNDIYGFSKGDNVIYQTATILKECGHHLFLGHIGGDDFIIVLYDWNFQSVCEKIIDRFNQMIPSIYNKEHLEQGYVITKNRVGIPEKIPLLSISIAVVTNQHHTFKTSYEIVEFATKIKKECKSISDSCYLTNDLVKCM